MSLSIKHAPLSDNPEALNLGPYMCVADANLRVISIFDDLKYDRADVDMMSPGDAQSCNCTAGSTGF